MICSMGMKQRWLSAQKEESDCWIQHEKKLNTPEYLRLKKMFWHKLFAKIFPDKHLRAEQRVLDFGCGPSGVVLEIADQCQLTCLDSLMNEYIEHFPFLKNYYADYQQGQMETFVAAQPFDLVLGFNSLDHVENIPVALHRTLDLLKGDGVAVFTLNCHTVSWVRFVFSKLNIILDPPHPHQYTEKQYQQIIEGNGFHVERAISLDEETRWINEETKGKPEKVSFLRKIRQNMGPQKVFFNFMGLFGYSVYGLPNEKCLFVHRAFYCRKQKSV
ncbi:MAG: methyltransferase domain-containing protein [Candidatus Uhrbacteria bacterium]|nr:methyltransferase domain-containing protein [Candidatus Uhrbacteria bacterium]